MILRVMAALGRVPADARVLACPEDSADEFRPLAAEAGFELFAGPKEDVLGRYCLAIGHFALDTVIRATGDNPFVFADAAAEITAQALSLNADYATYGGLPLGGGVEVVSAEALLRAGDEAKNPSEREHVCPYLYGNPETFLVHRAIPPRQWQGSDIRLTVDTLEDYRRAQILHEALDARKKSTELFSGDRYKGAIIIDAYLKAFRGADRRQTDGPEPA